MQFDFWYIAVGLVVGVYGLRMYSIQKASYKRPGLDKLTLISPTSVPKSVAIDPPFVLEPTTQQDFSLLLARISKRVSLHELNQELAYAGLLPTTTNDLVLVSDQLDGLGQVIAPSTTVNSSGKTALPVLIEINGQGHIFPDYNHRQGGCKEITFHEGELILVKKRSIPRPVQGINP